MTSFHLGHNAMCRNAPAMLRDRKDYGHEPYNNEVLWMRFALSHKHDGTLYAEDFLPFAMTRREGDREYHYPFARSVEIRGTDFWVTFHEQSRVLNRNVTLREDELIVHIGHTAVRYQKSRRLARGECLRALRS